MRRWRNHAMVAERDVERVHPVMQPSRVARTRLRRGVVALARVPFDSDERYQDAACAQEREVDKVRPVVVVEVTGGECVCRPCSSADSRVRYPWAYTEIEDLASAGLSRATAVRLREVSLHVSDCIEVCGVLAEADLQKVFGRLCAAGDSAPAEAPAEAPVEAPAERRGMSVVADTVFA